MNQNITEKIRSILVQEWDPFCVGDNPNLSDEYDQFIDGIANLILQKVSSDKLNAHLAEIEKAINAKVSDSQRSQAVDALIKLDSQ